jgi:hypothetical protein
MAGSSATGICTTAELGPARMMTIAIFECVTVEHRSRRMSWRWFYEKETFNFGFSVEKANKQNGICDIKKMYGNQTPNATGSRWKEFPVVASQMPLSEESPAFFLYLY